MMYLDEAVIVKIIWAPRLVRGIGIKFRKDRYDFVVGN